jgi:hypothetical protein
MFEKRYSVTSVSDVSIFYLSVDDSSVQNQGFRQFIYFTFEWLLLFHSQRDKG